MFRSTQGVTAGEPEHTSTNNWFIQPKLHTVNSTATQLQMLLRPSSGLIVVGSIPEATFY